MQRSPAHFHWKCPQTSSHRWATRVANAHKQLFLMMFQIVAFTAISIALFERAAFPFGFAESLSVSQLYLSSVQVCTVLQYESSFTTRVHGCWCSTRMGGWRSCTHCMTILEIKVSFWVPFKCPPFVHFIMLCIWKLSEITIYKRHTCSGLCNIHMTKGVVTCPLSVWFCLMCPLFTFSSYQFNWNIINFHHVQFTFI